MKSISTSISMAIMLVLPAIASPISLLGEEDITGPHYANTTTSMSVYERDTVTLNCRPQGFNWVNPPMLDNGKNFINGEADAACSVGPGPNKCMTLVCGGKVKMEVCNDDSKTFLPKCKDIGGYVSWIQDQCQYQKHGHGQWFVAGQVVGPTWQVNVMGDDQNCGTRGYNGPSSW